MGSIGLELMLIQLHGRWKPRVVEHYFSTSPLASISEKIRSQIRDVVLKQPSSQSVGSDLVTQHDPKLLAALNDLRDRLEQIGKAHDQLVEKCEELEAGKRKPMFVYACNTKRWHYTLTPELYSTLGCRWAYRGSDVKLQEDEPLLLHNQTKCFSCFPLDAL